MSKEFFDEDDDLNIRGRTPNRDQNTKPHKPKHYESSYWRKANELRDRDENRRRRLTKPSVPEHRTPGEFYHFLERLRRLVD